MKFNQSVSVTQYKNFVLPALLSIILFSSAVPSTHFVVNFTGEWKLNEQKSEMGQFGGRMAAKKMKVESKPDSLSYERTITGEGGEDVAVKGKVTFDGKETESIVFGNAKRKATAKWSDDGQSMIVNSTIALERNGETIEIKVSETWKLIDNGNSLSIESNSSSSFGENTMKLIYDKSK